MPPTLHYEHGYTGVIAGVDEAGRGPWAGPVTAAAVVLNIAHIPVGLDDSKKLSAAKREQLFDVIMQHCDVAIGMASVAEIDALNILGATKLAMQRAVSGLSSSPNVALIDGNQPPKLACKTVAIIKGDAKSLSIAAASIIAKVTRDRMMSELACEFPHYSWEKNAGYGTKKHQDGIALHGITDHHRRSFKPIKLWLDNAAA